MRRKPTPKQPRKPAVKPKCLFHDPMGRDCICIRPVQDQAHLEKRLKNQEGLSRFGIEV